MDLLAARKDTNPQVGTTIGHEANGVQCFSQPPGQADGIGKRRSKNKGPFNLLILIFKKRVNKLRSPEFPVTHLTSWDVQLDGSIFWAPRIF